MNKKVKQILIKWLPLATLITLLCGLLYVCVQQNYRMSANDPQIQLAEDVRQALLNNQLPDSFIPPTKTELSNSLSNFIMLFDANQKLIGASIVLDGKEPTLPKGVLEASKKNGQTFVTWQPKDKVREALVVYYYHGNQSGYVAVGRSLREVEKREDNLLKIVFIGWLTTLAATFLVKYFVSKFK